MPNRLRDASSPYLRQHADNPVDWHEWGDEAFNEAAARDVPVLLSVGYSACHWCHVMAHESFEDDATAAFMNEHFVNVKVDREERPDLDRIYMEAVQAMTGQGGWPMTLVLTPGGEPFFAGTYFPKDTRGRYPSFMHVLTRIQQAWKEERGDFEEQAHRLTSAVRRELPPADEVPGAYVISAAVEQMAAGYDWEHGGFGGAPKFPQAPNLELLLRTLALDVSPATQGTVEGMLRASLDNMAAGGIYDHLGGGFARYAVDRTWLVPHFEKMLYDNALLARVYLRAWQLTGNSRYRTVARETLDYILEDLRHPEGGLFSAEDADSEGVEGKFYTWTLDELVEVLDDEAPLVAAVYGATADGNFEGTNILHRPRALDEIASKLQIAADEIEQRIKVAGDRLRTARAQRIRPGLDDKVITAWNGLGLRALAEAGAVLGDERYVEAGRAVARFVHTHLTEEGRLLRSWRDGVVSGNGFCDDYSAMAVGLAALFQATGEIEWYDEADRLTREMVRLFADPQGGFYATGNDAERLIARPKNLMDNPTPSDNSLAAEALLTLAAYTGDSTLRDQADGVFLAAGRLLEQHPGAVGHLLAVLAVAGPGLKEVAIIGERDRRRPLEQVIWDTFRPDCVVAAAESPGTGIPLLVDRTSRGDTPLAYVCRNFTCELPVDTPYALRQQLGMDPSRIGAD